MNKLIIAFCISGVVLTSCKEKAPYIKLNDLNYVDSPYTASPIPTADAHNVLVEEFTGASCTNCPAAHKTLETIEAANPNRVNVIGLYMFNIAQTVPPNGAAYDFRDQTATDIGSGVYAGISSLPNGGLDRNMIDGAIQVPQGKWNSNISSMLHNTTPVNIRLQSHFSGGGGTITADIVYTSTVSVPQRLSIVIVEDGIKDKQEYPAFDPNFPSGVDDSYDFTNVFRQMITSPVYGDLVFPAATAGTAIKRTYTFTLSSKVVKSSNCRVIAFIANDDDKKVVQSVQTTLVQ